MNVTRVDRALATIKLLVRGRGRGFQVARSRFFRDLTDFESGGADTDHQFSKIVLDVRSRDWTATHPIRKTVFESGFAADKISEHRPSRVHDVGSYHEYLFTLSSFVDVTVVDTRKLQSNKRGLTFVHGEARDLPFADGECEFFTSLCVIPHVGLGRYGDEIDPIGDVRFVNEVHRCLKPGGHFVASMIVASEPVLRFNAHRTYGIEQSDDLVSDFVLGDEIFISLQDGQLSSQEGRRRLEQGQYRNKEYLVRVVCLRKP